MRLIKWNTRGWTQVKTPKVAELATTEEALLLTKTWLDCPLLGSLRDFKKLELPPPRPLDAAGAEVTFLVSPLTPAQLIGRV